MSNRYWFIHIEQQHFDAFGSTSFPSGCTAFLSPFRSKSFHFLDWEEVVDLGGLHFLFLLPSNYDFVRPGERSAPFFPLGWNRKSPPKERPSHAFRTGMLFSVTALVGILFPLLFLGKETITRKREINAQTDSFHSGRSRWPSNLKGYFRLQELLLNVKLWKLECAERLQ